MSLHAGQEKKLLRGQIIIAKVTLERAQGSIKVVDDIWRKIVENEVFVPWFLSTT